MARILDHEGKVLCVQGVVSELKSQVGLFMDAIGTLGHEEWDGTIVMQVLTAHLDMTKERLANTQDYLNRLTA
jgi:hypothetical protein